MVIQIQCTWIELFLDYVTQVILYRIFSQRNYAHTLAFAFGSSQNLKKISTKNLFVKNTGNLKGLRHARMRLHLFADSEACHEQMGRIPGSNGSLGRALCNAHM